MDPSQNKDNGIISTYNKTTESNEKLIQCTFRYRFKNCPNCNEENDIAARSCQHCHKAIIDPDDQLKTALSLREAKVIRCAGMSLSNNQNKPSQLVVSYHDEHGDELKEYFDFNLPKQQLLFNHLFCRRLQTAYSNAPSEFTKACDVLPWESKLQAPDFVIARKPNKRAKFWNIQDRLFDYEGNYRKANQL
jgi:DNA repair protein RadD